jgi:hypothetical protein
MNWSKNYLNLLKKEVHDWELVSNIQILKEKYLKEIDAGFIRIKIILKNNDILELSEYVQTTNLGLEVKSYTFHWQDANGHLKKRWDNASHHLKIATYPHHLHDGNEGNIIESDAMNFKKIKNIIQNSIS